MKVHRQTTERLQPYFKSPNLLAKWLIVFLLAEVAITLISSLTNLSELANTEVDRYWKITIDSLETIIGVAVIGLFVAWFFRVYHNLNALGIKGLRYSAKRVVISFFIIGLNLFEPIKGLKDLWKASDPNVDMSDLYSWKKVTAPAGLGLWWFFAVATRFHDVHFFGTGTEFLQLVWDVFVVPISLIIINTATIIIVKRINSRQEVKRVMVNGEEQ